MATPCFLVFFAQDEGDDDGRCGHPGTLLESLPADSTRAPDAAPTVSANIEEINLEEDTCTADQLESGGGVIDD
jgi:hypothetical protein